MTHPEFVALALVCCLGGLACFSPPHLRPDRMPRDSPTRPHPQQEVNDVAAQTAPSAESYSPGLEGVIAGETAISTVVDGLSYRGYKVTELCGAVTLLWLVPWSTMWICQLPLTFAANFSDAVSRSK